MPSHIQLHATCISIDGKGVLLLGPSGSGKSDLALRLIDGGALLVADDRVDIRVFPPSLTLPHEGGGNKLIASAPEQLRGMLEARGIGILTIPYVQNTPLSLAINLVQRNEIERLPEPQFWSCLGLQLPLHSLHAFDISTCAKIRMHMNTAKP